MIVLIQSTHGALADGDFHGLLLAGFQFHTGETAEIALGLDGGADPVTQIQLRHSNACPIADVGNGDGSGDSLAGGDLIGVQLEAAVLELGIAQTVAEGIQRSPAHFHVLAAAAGTAGVVARHLAHMTGVSNGQTTGRIVVAEEGVHNGVSAPLAGEVALQNGRNVLLLPGAGDRTASVEQQHNGSAGGVNGLDQLQLVACQIQIHTVEVFATGQAVVIADTDQSHLGLLGSLHRSGEVFHAAAIAETNHGALLVVGVLDTDGIGLAGFVVEGNQTVIEAVLAPAIQDQFAVDVDLHRVFAAEADEAVEGIVRFQAAGPDHAEAFLAQLLREQRAVRVTDGPAAVDLAVRPGNDRLALKRGAVVVTGGEAGVAGFVLEHILGEGNDHIAHEAAALCIKDLGIGQSFTQSIHGVDGILSVDPVGIVAAHGGVRAGANHSDGLQFLGQGQQVILVLQQDKALTGDLLGQFQMLSAVEDLVCQRFIGVGILKQTHHHLDPQHTAGSLLHNGALHPAAFHQIRNALHPHIVGEIKQLQVHTGFQTHLHGVFFGFCHIEPVVQTGNGGHVGANKAAHAPLVAENFRQQFMVHRHRHVAHGGIGTHGTHSAGILESSLKDRQAIAESLVAAHSSRRTVQAGDRLAIGCVVLGFRCHRVVGSQIVALHTQNALAGELGSQEGILAVSFLGTTKPGITHQVHNRTPDFPGAFASGFHSDGVTHLLCQFRLKGRSQTDLLGEQGSALEAGAVKALVGQQEGNAQTGLFNCVALHFIELRYRQGKHLDGAGAAAVENLIQLFGNKDSVVRVADAQIDAVVLIRLHDQFLQGHTADQVIQTLLDIKLRVLIGKHKSSSCKFVFFIIAHPHGNRKNFVDYLYKL